MENEHVFSLSSEINKVSDKVARLEVEIAERRPISEIIRYSTYAIGIVVFIFGFMGYKQISDLKGSIIESLRGEIPAMIDRTLKEREETIAKAINFSRDIEIKKQKVDSAFAEFRAQAEELKNIRILSSASDIEAEFLRIQSEAGYRLQATPNFISSEPFKGTHLEEAWRLGIIKRIRDIISDKEGLAAVDPDEIFNIAQTIRGLKNSALVAELVGSLPISNDPAIEAMRMVTIIQSTSGDKQSEAYSTLLGLVSNINERSPQIVLAEAWNASENLRNYSGFIAAAESAEKNLSASGLPIPSYLNAMIAQTYLRRGYSGDIDLARSHVEKAVLLLESETPMNQWYNSTAEILRKIAISFSATPSSTPE